MKGDINMQVQLRLNESETKQLNELKQYYKTIFGDQTNTWIVKQAIFQEWLKNVEVPKHNKK